MLNEQQLQTMMDTYAEKLLRIAYFYMKNTQVAEDIVQEVFIVFYYTNKYTEQGELGAFLARMTSNKCKDYLKSWAYRTHLLKEKLEIWKNDDVQQQLIQNQEAYAIEQAILKLPLKVREPVVYFYYEEMKIREIAELLHIPESTVKTRLTKAKTLLRDELRGYEWEVLLHD